MLQLFWKVWCEIMEAIRNWWFLIRTSRRSLFIFVDYQSEPDQERLRTESLIKRSNTVIPHILPKNMWLDYLHAGPSYIAGTGNSFGLELISRFSCAIEIAVQCGCAVECDLPCLSQKRSCRGAQLAFSHAESGKKNELTTQNLNDSFQTVAPKVCLEITPATVVSTICDLGAITRSCQRIRIPLVLQNSIPVSVETAGIRVCGFAGFVNHFVETRCHLTSLVQLILRKRCVLTLRRPFLYKTLAGVRFRHFCFFGLTKCSGTTERAKHQRKQRHGSYHRWPWSTLPDNTHDQSHRFSSVVPAGTPLGHTEGPF